MDESGRERKPVRGYVAERISRTSDADDESGNAAMLEEIMSLLVNFCVGQRC